MAVILLYGVKKNMDIDKDILGLKDLYDILPFGEKKIRKLISAGELPVVKVGKTYITTKDALLKWIEENIGHELYY